MKFHASIIHHEIPLLAQWWLVHFENCAAVNSWESDEEKLKWISGADAGFRVRGGASGVSRIQKIGGGGGGALQVRYTKSGGALQVPYTKSGGGGASGPIYEKWGGGGPFHFRYLWARRKYVHVPTYVLPRYTSHARANERKIHAGKG